MTDQRFKKMVLLLGCAVVVLLSFGAGVLIMRTPPVSPIASGTHADTPMASAIAELPATAAAAIDLKQGLVLHMSFKTPDVQGLLQDESGNGNDGLVIGASWTSRDGRGAYLFQNPVPAHISDTILVDPSASLRVETVTLAAWFNTTNNDRGRLRKIISRCSSEDTGYGLNLGNTSKGDVSMWVAADGSQTHWLKCTKLVTDGSWHQVVGTYDGHGMKIYIDGQLDMGQENLNQWEGSLASHVAPIEIGHVFNPKQDGFDGQISDVRIYSRPLSADEVLALYSQTSNP